MFDVATADLIYDPNEVGADLVAACLVSQSPRADDPSFDPKPGDVLMATDVDDEILSARVVRREGNLIWIQLDIPGLLTTTTPGL